MAWAASPSSATRPMCQRSSFTCSNGVQRSGLTMRRSTGAMAGNERHQASRLGGSSVPCGSSSTVISAR